MVEKFRQFLEKRNIKKENFLLLVLLLVIVLTVFSLSKFFGFNLDGVLLVFVLILFSILCLITWFMAGVVVFRSLIVASVSLSVIIFLAQTYCDLPTASHTADEALKNLFSFGLIYSAFLFVSSFKKELLGDKDNKEKKGSLNHLEEIYKGKKPWMILFLYAGFIGLFLWELYQVATPIVHNLCIYKP